MSEWKEIHQPYELNYHLSQGIKWCSDDSVFLPFWNNIKEFIQPKGEVLDIGSGPRPAFEGSTCIDPLIEEYKKATPESWWNGITGISGQAEKVIVGHLFGTVVIWNCLDHTESWKTVLHNALSQLKPEGKLAIGVDFKLPHVGHPGVPKEQFFEAISSLKELDRRENFQERDLAIILQK